MIAFGCKEERALAAAGKRALILARHCLLACLKTPRNQITRGLCVFCWQGTKVPKPNKERHSRLNCWQALIFCSEIELEASCAHGCENRDLNFSALTLPCSVLCCRVTPYTHVPMLPTSLQSYAWPRKEAEEEDEEAGERSSKRSSGLKNYYRSNVIMYMSINFGD
jgi:hypothetical protein